MTFDQIKRAVCDHYGIRMADLIGPTRKMHIARPRMLAMLICREYLGATYPAIGRAFGGRDHSTAMHAVMRSNYLIFISPAGDDYRQDRDAIVAAAQDMHEKHLANMVSRKPWAFKSNRKKALAQARNMV